MLPSALAVAIRINGDWAIKSRWNSSSRVLTLFCTSLDGWPMMARRSSSLVMTSANGYSAMWGLHTNMPQVIRAITPGLRHSVSINDGHFLLTNPHPASPEFGGGGCCWQTEGVKWRKDAAVKASVNA